VLYIGQGDEVRGRGRKSGGRRWELGRWLLMAPFRVGEEMGEGEMEGEGRGWGSSAILGGVEGRGRRAIQGGMRGAVALDWLGGGGFIHDGRKGTTGPCGPSWAERLR
jgi:hypothetical protein